MKTLLALVLSLVVLAACGGDEFSAARVGAEVAGEPGTGTGGATSAAGAGGETATGGTDTGGSAAVAGSGGDVAGTGGATETGAAAGTGGADTGGTAAGGLGSGGSAGEVSSGGAGGTPPVVFEEPRPLCGKTPKGGTCERVVANGSDTTCEVDGHCWCPTGSVLCRDTRFPLDKQLMCQRGTTCGQPKATLDVSCTNDNQCGGGALCAESLQVCFCATSTSKVCRSATGNITCTAAGTPCAY